MQDHEEIDEGQMIDLRVQEDYWARHEKFCPDPNDILDYEKIFQEIRTKLYDGSVHGAFFVLKNADGSLEFRSHNAEVVITDLLDYFDGLTELAGTLDDALEADE